MHRLVVRRSVFDSSVPAVRRVSRACGVATNHGWQHERAQSAVLVATPSQGLHYGRPPVSFSVRTLRTGSPPHAKSVKSSEADLPPPAAPPSVKAKVKVELRPGPTKSTTLEPAATKTSTAKGAVNSKSQASIGQTQKGDRLSETAQARPSTHEKPDSTESTSLHIEKKKAEKQPSVIDIAKQDVDDAARHGILAPPPPGAGMVRTLIHQAKELFKFYWSGLKLIFANGRRVKAIQARVKAGGPPISRAENRFIQTYRSDIVKLVPFLIMVIVVEEIIPLVVLYAPGFLPSTCLLPSQRERIDATRYARQRSAYADRAKRDIVKDDVGVELAAAVKEGRGIAPLELNADVLGTLCGVVGLSERGTATMRARRLAKYLKRIAEDDIHLIAERRGARLSPSGLVEALWERGFLADTYSLTEQRERLTWWLDNVSRLPSPSATSNGILKMYLTPKAVRTRLLIEMVRTSDKAEVEQD